MEIYNGTFSVYAHINKMNGKMYVGITSRKVENRWNNGHGYKKSYFENAIKKYGWDAFDHEVIASNLTEEEAMHMEEFLIKELNLQNHDYGYNIRYGGTNCLLSEETKRKIGQRLSGRKYDEARREICRQAHLGKKLAPEHVQHIKEALTGRKQSPEEIQRRRMALDKYYGENHWTRKYGVSEETRNKISTKVKEYYKTHKVKDRLNVLHPVQNIETGEIFKSIQAAADRYGICRSSISENAAGKRKSAGGYHWKFVERLETIRKE